MDGCKEGDEEGMNVGSVDGCREGVDDGFIDGTSEREGKSVGT